MTHWRHFIAQTKAAKAKRKRSWPNVYTRVHGSGQVSYVVDIGLINGKRERHLFKTKAKAEAGTFAELKRTERQNQGTAALAMPQAIKVDAAKASELIVPAPTIPSQRFSPLSKPRSC